MKASDINEIKQNILGLKQITDNEEYLVSSNCNILYNKILPILDVELERVSNQRMEINAPAVLIVEKTNKNTSLTDVINIELARLVSEDYKIIDYNITTLNDSIVGIIKYTT